VLLGLLKLGEVISAVAVLVLAFTSPRHTLFAVNSFGAFVGLRAMLIFLYGLRAGQMFWRKRVYLWSQAPFAFSLLSALNFVVMVIGVGLFFLPHPVAS
jgi:hypothetical protein